MVSGGIVYNSAKNEFTFTDKINIEEVLTIVIGGQDFLRVYLIKSKELLC